MDSGSDAAAEGGLCHPPRVLAVGGSLVDAHRMRCAWLAAAVVLTACGGHHRSPAPPHPALTRPPTGTPHSDGPRVLRGVRFATTPVVMLSPCAVKNARKCADLTYVVYARLDRRIPRAKHLGWA